MNGTPYQTTVVNALGNLYDKVLSYLPNLVAAAIVLILGWIVASLLSKLILRFLELIQIDRFANQLGLSELSQRAGRPLSLAKLGAWIVKWFFFLGSFIGAAEILGLSEVTRFMYDDVLGYAGRVIIAMAILMLGILAANFFAGLVSGTVKAGGLQTAETLGVLTRWSIVIFAAFAALSQLGIASTYLNDLFRAIIAMLAISGGIAFGLGGRDHAKKVLDTIERDLSR